MTSDKKILIVDDDRDFAESIALRCRTRGWQAQTADSPLAAVVSLVSHPPDLVCLDVNMPTANGLDMCEHLLRSPDRPQQPVIVLTGQSDQETIRRTSRLEARYVRKSPDLWLRLEPLMELLLRAPDSSRHELAPLHHAETKGADCYG